MNNVNKNNNQGFTLIELMIVVAIIAIIAAIAIPNLLNAKMSGNEAAAVSGLRTLSTVTEQYRNRNAEYPALLGDLNDPTGVSYIDANFAAATSTAKSGYLYTFVGSPTAAPTTWTCTAVPVTWGSDGARSFFVDQSGVIRSSSVSGTTASVTSSPIQ
ncbi:MAG: type IV pilin protein [Planctomycetota bacterium]